MKTLFRLILILALVCLRLQAGTITGQITTATNGPIVNGTLTLTLNQFAVVSGTAAIAPTAVSCFTDVVGNVVGLPNPLVAPVLSVNLASGTLGSGTYFVVYAWSNATGTTFYSPESSILLSSAGTLIVAVPASPPAGATNWKIFIGTTSGGETQQISQGTPFTNYSQSAALSAGSALPGSNTSTCSLRFNDELVPSFTKYNVSLKFQSGATVSGFPMFWQLFGGNAGTINVSNGFPLASNAVVYPFPIVTNPNSQSQQSINGPLTLNGFGLTDTGTNSFTGNQNVINAQNFNGNLWVGSGGYATIGACLAALPAKGGTCWVGQNNTNGSYNETLSANLAITTNVTAIVFTVPAVITQGTNQVTISAGAQSVAIRSLLPGTNNFPAGGTSSVDFTYTGTTAAWVIGGSGSASNFLAIDNIHIDIHSAGGSAVGLALNRVNNSNFKNVEVSSSGANTQIAWQLNGNGGFTGNDNFDNCRGTGTQVLWQLINSANNNHFDGGGGSTTVASNIGVDLQNGNGNEFKGMDSEALVTAYKLGNSATVFGNHILAFISGNTTDFSFGAASFNNFAMVVGGLGAGADPVVSDSGTNNTVWNPRKFQLTSGGNVVTSGTVTASQLIAGTAAAGSTAGDVSAARSANSGVYYLGSDGNVNFFRTGGGGIVQLVGAQFQLPGGIISNYNGTNTAGQGLPPIYGATSQKAETQAADANVLTVTPPAAVGTYRVSVAVSVSSATNGVISYTVSWTDSSGNAQSNIAGPLFQYGTAAPNTTFTTSAAGNYKGDMLVDVNNAAASIIVKWVGGGTTVAKMSATIERLQ